MKKIEINPAETKRFFDFVNIIVKNTTDEQHKDMLAPTGFEVEYDEKELSLRSIKWIDIKGYNNSLYFPKHPEQIMHWIVGKVKLSRYECKPLFKDICQLLTDDFGGYLDKPIFSSIKDIEEIIVGTDGDHLTTFIVIDKNDNHHDLRYVFFENEIVSLMVIVYNIMGIADKICKAI